MIPAEAAELHAASIRRSARTDRVWARVWVVVAGLLVAAFVLAGVFLDRWPWLMLVSITLLAFLAWSGFRTSRIKLETAANWDRVAASYRRRWVP